MSPATAPTRADLEPLVGGYLGRQRWFAGPPSSAAGASLVALEALRPGLVWALAEVGPATYQLLVGARPEDEAVALLGGQEGAVLGSLPSGEIAYDALVDPELALAVLDIVTEGRERAERIRPVGAEQSNSSLIFDDRVILKVFRRLQQGPNPDVEVTLALDRVGFNHLAAPLGHWRRDDLDLDLAIAQEFLHGGTEGWSLALTSLRDLYARVGEIQGGPVGVEVAAAAGGDFGAEARRLGEMTARLHLALAASMGEEDGRPQDWSADVAHQVATAREALETARAGAVPRPPDRTAEEAEASAPAEGPQAAPPEVESLGSERVDELIARLGQVSHPGRSVRVHGDYHLGQVMRTDQGWFVLDFEGEPARPLADRRRPRSPLKDVAGMLRSLDYATAAALKDRADGERILSLGLDRAWEERNRASFLQGYLSMPQMEGLLPAPGRDLDTVLRAMEVEKAAYELAYELAYRPTWADIPARALDRLLLGGGNP